MHTCCARLTRRVSDCRWVRVTEAGEHPPSVRREDEIETAGTGPEREQEVPEGPIKANERSGGLDKRGARMGPMVHENGNRP